MCVYTPSVSACDGMTKRPWMGTIRYPTFDIVADALGFICRRYIKV